MFNITKSLRRNLSIKPGKMSMNINMTNRQYRKGDFDGDGVPNFKDCRPFDRTRDMVRFVYYEVEDEQGNIFPVYAGSIKGARRIMDDKGIKVVSIKEMTHNRAKEKFGDEGLVKSRIGSKPYKSSGVKITDNPLG